MNAELSQLILNLVDGADDEGCTKGCSVVKTADVVALDKYVILTYLKGTEE